MTELLDQIKIKDLRLIAFCGVLEEEQVRRQLFDLNLCLFADVTNACKTDDLKSTVNYAAVIDAVAEVCASRRFVLLERFAEVIAEVCLSFERVQKVEVEITKVRPPVPYQLSGCAIAISRTK